MPFLKGARLFDIPIRYLTLRKGINYLKYMKDVKSRRVVTSSYPPDITFQASAYCNTNCRLCPVGLGIKGPPKGFLSLESFKKVIDELKDVLIKITFADWGEPFLNPDIFDMIRYAEENKVITHASTNLHWFKNEDDLRKLSESGLSFLTISLHGITQETYGLYQPGKDFETTVEKIKTLVAQKKGSRKPVIYITFAITKRNQHELEHMNQFTESLKARSTIYTASLNLRFHPTNTWKDLVNNWAQEGKSNLGVEGFIEKKGICNVYEAIRRGTRVSFTELDELGLSYKHLCQDPWRILVVNWNGTISLCCVDYWKYEMGNIYEEPVKKIWNNERYQAVRKYLLGQLPDKDVDFPCKACIHC